MLQLRPPSVTRTALAALEYAFAIASGISGARARFATPPDGKHRAAGGTLSVIRGWRFLRLEGRPGEIGFQHGRLLRPIIHDLLDTYIGALQWLRGMGREALLRRARRLEPYISGTLVEEMRGLAEGADMPYEDVLIGQTFLESVQSVACSCYAAWDGATADGRLVFGRNLEFFSLGVAHKCQVIALYRPEGAIPFVSITWPGMCGVLTGFNLAGLCIGPLNVNRVTTNLAGEPYVLMFRRVVQEANDIARAVSILRAARRTYPNNVLIAQTAPHRCAVVVEYTKDALVVREPKDGDSFIAATNHFRKLGRSEELPDHRGYLRYPALIELLRANRGRISIETDIFRDRRIHLPNSLHCLVAAPEAGKFRLQMGTLPAPRGPARVIRLRDLG